MITDAVWQDLNGNDVEELIVAGLWMPIRVFANSNGRLAEATDNYFDKAYSGLWNVLLAEDLDDDGRSDLVAGNLGLNSPIKASESEPAELYFGDLDNNGTLDPLLAYYVQGISYPYPTLDELNSQLPSFASQFAGHGDYARATTADLFGDGRLSQAQQLQASHLETTLFRQEATGKFVPHPLPIQAQLSPVFAVYALDYDADGDKDLLLAGNTEEAQIRLGKYDAGYGVLLHNDGKASFSYITQIQSGLRHRGPVRQIIGLNDFLVLGTNRGRALGYSLLK